MDDKHIFLFGVLGLVVIGGIFATTVLMKSSDNAITGEAFNLNIDRPCGTDLQYFGNEYYMDAGDTIVPASRQNQGFKLSLISTSIGGAVIEVSGVRDVISKGTARVVNGADIFVKDVAYDEGIEFDTALIYFSAVDECAKLKRQVCSR